MIHTDTARMNPAVKPADAMSDRTFGLFVGAVLLVVGSWPLAFGREAKPIPLSIAVVLILFGAVSPRVLHWPKRIWLSITHRIGQVVQFVLMGILFFGVVTPVGLFFKLIGRDALRRRWDPSATSYWLKRDGATDMKQQF